MQPYRTALTAQSDYNATASKAGYNAIEPWMNDIEAFVKNGGSIPDQAKRCRDLGLEVVSAIGFAPWIVNDDDKRKAGLEQARRDMDLTKQLNLRLVLLSQVNREQDALGAGAIMHNSNYVLAVERERTRAVASEGRVASAAENTFVDSVDAQIVVRKARDGASGVAAVYYDPCWFFNTAEEAYFAKRRRQNG